MNNIEESRLPHQRFIRVEVEPGVYNEFEVMPMPTIPPVDAGDEHPQDYVVVDTTEELLEAIKPHKFAPLFSSAKSDWETPQFLFDALNAEFNFTLDAAAGMENRKVQKFFSIHQDAFRLQWHGTVWLNPPYSDGIGKWLAKAKQSAIEGATVVVLVPARTDTNAWFDHARFGEVRFLKGRLKFVGAPTSAPFPSALCIFRPGLPRSTSYWVYTETKEAPFYEARQLE